MLDGAIDPRHRYGQGSAGQCPLETDGRRRPVLPLKAAPPPDPDVLPGAVRPAAARGGRSRSGPSDVRPRQSRAGHVRLTVTSSGRDSVWRHRDVRDCDPDGA